MEDEGKKLNRRKFIGQVGMGVAALSALHGTRMFVNRRVIGANDRIRIGLIGARDRG